MPLPRFRKRTPRTRNRRPTRLPRKSYRFRSTGTGGRGRPPRGRAPAHGGARPGGKRRKKVGAIGKGETPSALSRFTSKFIRNVFPQGEYIRDYGRALGEFGQQFIPPQSSYDRDPYSRYAARGQARMDGIRPGQQFLDAWGAGGFEYVRQFGGALRDTYFPRPGATLTPGRERVFDPNPYSRYGARGLAPELVSRLKSMPKTLTAQPYPGLTDLNYPYDDYGAGGYPGYGFGGGGYEEPPATVKPSEQARGAQFGSGERRPTGRGRAPALRDKRFYQKLATWSGW